MNDIFINQKEIEQDLENIKNLAAHLANRLALLTQTITYIFSHIKACETIEAAENYFMILDSIQMTLAYIVHHEDIGIPDRLWKFIWDFDNLQENKKRIFEKIRNNEYVF